MKEIEQRWRGRGENTTVIKSSNNLTYERAFHLQLINTHYILYFMNRNSLKYLVVK